MRQARTAISENVQATGIFFAIGKCDRETRTHVECVVHLDWGWDFFAANDDIAVVLKTPAGIHLDSYYGEIRWGPSRTSG